MGLGNVEQGCPHWVRPQGTASLSRADLQRRDPGSTSITECSHDLCSKENSNKMHCLKLECVLKKPLKNSKSHSNSKVLLAWQKGTKEFVEFKV